MSLNRDRCRRAAASGSAALILLALTYVALPARADQRDSALIRAVAAKERALELDDPLHWDEALRRFREADALGSTYETQYEIGNAAAQLEQRDVAVQAFERAIALGVKGRALQRAAAYVEANAAALSRLLVRGPAGARVFIAGEPRGRLPLETALVVYAGKLTVSLRLEDTRELSQTYDARTDQVHELMFRAPPPASGFSGRSVDAVAAPRATTLPLVALSAGAATALAGAILLPLSSAQLSKRREALASACDVQGQQDGCDHAKLGRQNEAQANANSIATWKFARGVGWSALGGGLVASGVGLWLMSRSSKTSEPHREQMVPWLEGTQQSWTAGVQGRF
jgi:hypothetical protein